MRSKVTVQQYDCDAPNCLNSYRVTKNEELPAGFHGKVTAISENGGDFAEFYACSQAHLKDAILAALDREGE